MMMTAQNRTRIYTGAVALTAIMLGGLGVWLWPLSMPTDRLWMLPTLAIIVAVTGSFAFKVSPQGDATLVTVPQFVAVLLLHPVEAMLVCAAGVFVSELVLKAPPRVWSLNVSVSVVVAGLGGMVFWSLQPGVSDMIFTPGVALAAGMSGAVMLVADLSLLFGMITLIKGRGFWRRWKETWSFEAVLDASLLVIGYIGAQLVILAWWSLLVLAVPLLVAYYAFSRSVREVVQKTTLAEELEKNLMNLKETQAQLVQSAKLATVGTLAAGIAHDINNPLTVISARSELLLARLQKLEQSPDIEKVISGIQDVHNMSARISTIVSQLLSHSRRSEDFADVRLDHLIDDAMPLLERKLERKNVTLVRDYEQTPMVHVIAGQLQQVFMNLVGNALDAIPELGTITLGCTVRDGVPTAYIKDTGTGIPKDVLDRIFEPFFTTKEVGNGTGLGLFISHKIVIDHGGELSVESKEGEGTTFWVKLPAAEGAEQRQSSVEVAVH